jgi:hypothetical protein
MGTGCISPGGQPPAPFFAAHSSVVGPSLHIPQCSIVPAFGVIADTEGGAATWCRYCRMGDPRRPLDTAQPGTPAGPRRPGRSTPTPLCGYAGGCASSIRSGDARAGLSSRALPRRQPSFQSLRPYLKPSIDPPHQQSSPALHRLHDATQRAIAIPSRIDRRRAESAARTRHSGIRAHRDAYAACPCRPVGSEPPFHQFSLRASSLGRSRDRPRIRYRFRTQPRCQEAGRPLRLVLPHQ